MLVIYDPSHAQHNPQYELYDGVKTVYPEVPDRIEVIATALRVAGHEFIAPRSYSDKALLKLHTAGYQNYLQYQSALTPLGTDCYPSNFIHDTYAPVTTKTYQAAHGALAVALTGAESILSGHDVAYGLCRPPGHHAGDAYMGGYCYFNNAALAADRMSGNGKVAVLDIDFHHGNGTQQLFYDRSDVLYVSVHADPKLSYPYTSGLESETGCGKGLGFTRNFTVPKNCGAEIYLLALNQALHAVLDFSPDYLVISLGFDGHKDDPIAGFGLDIKDYQEIAERIAQLRLPTLLIQEGGYNVAVLGDLAQTFTDAFRSPD
jgi:acetoin utilization deacetylase AcuC-like enzyme